MKIGSNQVFQRRQRLLELLDSRLLRLLNDEDSLLLRLLRLLLLEDDSLLCLGLMTNTPFTSSR